MAKLRQLPAPTLAFPKPGEEYSLQTAEAVALQSFIQQKQQAEAGLQQVGKDLCGRLGVDPRTRFELKGNKVVVLPSSPQSEEEAAAKAAPTPE